MTDFHPITPPPELVAKWASSMCGYYEAARWGAKEQLRTARRPKPPTLKEQALAALHGIHDQGPTPEQVTIIRRALEQLDG
jgi:hypothetical protein